MSSPNFTTKPLSQVDELLDDAPLLTNILIETEGKIKRYRLKTKILDRITALADIIGQPYKKQTDTTEEQLATGFYEQFDLINEKITEIDDNIGFPSGAEGSTGLYYKIEQAEKTIAQLNAKNFTEGVTFQFTTTSNLKPEEEIRYKISGYNLFDLSENASMNLQLNMEFEAKDAAYGKLYYSPIININTIINNSSHLTVLYLPIVEVKLVLKIDVTNTDINIKIINSVNFNNLKNDYLTIQNSNLYVNNYTLNI